MNMYQGLEQLKTYLELFKKERINYDKLKEASKEFSALLAFVSLHLETPKETHKKRQLYFCLSPSFFNKFKHNINHHNRLNIRIKYFIAYLLDIFLLLTKPLYPYFSSYLFLQASQLLFISNKKEIKKIKKRHEKITICTTKKHIYKLESQLNNSSVIYILNDGNSLNKHFFLKQQIIDSNINKEQPLWLMGDLKNFANYENKLKKILENQQLHAKTCFEIYVSEPLSIKSNHDISTILYLFEKNPYSLYFKTSNLFLTSYLLLRIASVHLNNVYFSFDYLYPNNVALCLDLLDQKTIIHTQYFEKDDLNYTNITKKILYQKAKEFEDSKHCLKPLFTKRVGTDHWHQLCNTFLD